MTGTSCDGVDLGLLETDGRNIINYIADSYLPFPQELIKKIRFLMNEAITIEEYRDIEVEYTIFCHQAMQQILAQHKVDIIGFHGQTLVHRPHKGYTHQMGYAKLLEKLTGKTVISDFRTDDILNGGQGAPLVPIFHRAAIKAPYPCAILNIGGVSNITYLDEECTIAFDTGIGMAPLNDIMQQYFSQSYDADGEKSRLGKCDKHVLGQLLQDPYFSQKLPKSLDRNHFTWGPIEHLSPQDKLATLCHFIAESVALSFSYFPQKPKASYVTGGGRKNAFLMELLARLQHTEAIEKLGINGDMLEAYAFAYLAVQKHINGKIII